MEKYKFIFTNDLSGLVGSTLNGITKGLNYFIESVTLGKDGISGKGVMVPIRTEKTDNAFSLYNFPLCIIDVIPNENDKKIDKIENLNEKGFLNKLYQESFDKFLKDLVNFVKGN